MLAVYFDSESILGLAHFSLRHCYFFAVIVCGHQCTALPCDQRLGVLSVGASYLLSIGKQTASRNRKGADLLRVGRGGA